MYDMPSGLRKAIEAFVHYYNNQRYHEALSNITPADVYFGRKDEIPAWRKGVGRETLQSRRKHNQTLRGLEKVGPEA